MFTSLVLDDRFPYTIWTFYDSEMDDKILN